MNTNNTPQFDGLLGVFLGSLGVLCLVAGVLLLSESALGGLWIAAIGASLIAAILVGSTWGRQRLGLTPGRTSAPVGFVAVALVLAVAFAVVNFASFSTGSV